MQVPTSIDLEQALHRYGDGVYRLALLLSPDESQAAAALSRAVRRLASQPGHCDEVMLIAALLAVLPRERRRRLPWSRSGWAVASSIRADDRAVVMAMTRLPRHQRLVLGLTMLRALDSAQVAQVLGAATLDQGVLLRDALLALGPVAAPGVSLAELNVEGAPVECQPTRAALASDRERVHADPALRGHLALCAACRNVEGGWFDLYAVCERALRGALLDVVMPVALVAQLRALVVSEPLRARPAMVFDRRVGVALVVVVVMVVIGLVVVPRYPSRGVTTPATAVVDMTPQQLVQRAADRLYEPPSGAGVWHGRWDLHWNFADGSYAALHGDEWVDTASDRHRLQLVHEAGGGPYEFELADDGGQVWYAVGGVYGPSVYPLAFDPDQARVHVSHVVAEQQRALRQARLDSGAWGIARAYLRQALAAPKLQRWGHQGGDGVASLELLSFRGVSPLALPSDAPQATASEVMILLAIDSSTGVLQEVREIFGGAAEEQTSRVSWRFVGGEWLADAAEVARGFDMAQAWNGVGVFREQADVVDVMLPLVDSGRVVPLARALLGQQVLEVPMQVPMGATRALLVAGALSSGRGSLLAMYGGVGRRFVTMSWFADGGVAAFPDAERVMLGDREVLLAAGGAQSYQALLMPGRVGGRQVVTQVSALGYTRGEFLEALRSFGPLNLAVYQAQARLFVEHRAYDAAVFDALVGALAQPAIPAGMTRHGVAQVFTRHRDDSDQLPDPYHVSLQRDQPEQMRAEVWSRGDVVSRTWQVTSLLRDDQGVLFQQMHVDGGGWWYYDRLHGESYGVVGESGVQVLGGADDVMVILELLGCGEVQRSTLADGTIVLVSQAPALNDLGGSACDYRRYGEAIVSGRERPSFRYGVYLRDVVDRPIVTRVYLGVDGRVARYDVRAGDALSSVLLESWVRVGDDVVPDAQVPLGVFDAVPPMALTQTVRVAGVERSSIVFDGSQVISSAEALRFVATPLWTLPADDSVSLMSIEMVAVPITDTGGMVLEPFHLAVFKRRALRFTYTTSDTKVVRFSIYQGSAEGFGAVLRTQEPVWVASSAVQVTIGGRVVEGWLLTLRNRRQWLVVEVDGTLVAIDAMDGDPLALAGRLQPLSSS